MFTPTWNKYMPIIKILLKRSLTAEQKLDMNGIDFQRAAGGRKVKFNFSMTLTKGRLQPSEKPPPLARELVEILQQDEMTRQIVRQHVYEFALNSNFQLSIKNCTPAEEEVTETTNS